jgi:hypothetical protein
MDPYVLFQRRSANAALRRENVNVVAGSGKASGKVGGKPANAADKGRRILMGDEADPQAAVLIFKIPVLVNGQACALSKIGLLASRTLWQKCYQFMAGSSTPRIPPWDFFA